MRDRFSVSKNVYRYRRFKYAWYIIYATNLNRNWGNLVETGCCICFHYFQGIWPWKHDTPKLDESLLIRGVNLRRIFHVLWRHYRLIYRDRKINVDLWPISIYSVCFYTAFSRAYKRTKNLWFKKIMFKECTICTLRMYMHNTIFFTLDVVCQGRKKDYLLITIWRDSEVTGRG